MSEELTTILDFVEGRIDARQFESMLYSNAARFEDLLNQDPDLLVGSYAAPSVFLFLVQQDFSDPGDVLSVHGALVEYLQRHNISSNPTRAYADFYEMLLQAQPSWLFADMKYLATLIEASGGRVGEELEQWLHAEILKRFRFLAAPPDWIQDPPVWPMSDAAPLFFLGQMDIDGYFHDVAAAYIFHSREKGFCETIIQIS